MTAQMAVWGRRLQNNRPVHRCAQHLIYLCACVFFGVNLCFTVVLTVVVIMCVLVVEGLLSLCSAPTFDFF